MNKTKDNRGAAFKLEMPEFSQKIIDRVASKKCGYIEAVLSICDEYRIDPEMVSSLISDPIKQKLQSEGQEINLLPRTGVLSMG